MSDLSVLFVRPGAIKPNDKGRLYKAGIIVVEVDDPDDVKLVTPQSLAPITELSHGELLLAFAKGVLESGLTLNVGKHVANAIVARHGNSA